MIAPEGSPCLYYYVKGQIRALEQKGCDWPLSKGRAGGEAGARISVAL